MKLNLGSGDCPLDGYENLDAKTGDSLFPLLKYQRDGQSSSIVDRGVDEVRASHVLEHFSHHQTLDVLKEWARVLKPGGWLKIAVPDFDWISTHRFKSDDPLSLLEAYLFGGQVDENDYHKALFTNKKLYEMLQSVGLTNIQTWTSEIKDCASLPVSLNLMGRKPEAKSEWLKPISAEKDLPIIEDQLKRTSRSTSRTQVFAAGRWQDLEGEVQCATQEELDAANAGQLQTRTIVLDEKRAARIALCLSTPRIGFLRPFERLLALAHQAGISVFSGDGVFFHHAMSRSIRNAIEFDFEDGTDGFDFILTADYDTYAMIEDIRGLAELLARSPEADCIVPLQMKRGGTGEILAGGQNMNLTQPLVPIETGHFGLTIFRKSFFERLPTPWFYEKADADGHWGDGRIDADIGFWLNAKKAKLNVMLAPQIVVGHGEELITYPRIENGKVVKVYQAVNDWLGVRAKPEGIGVIQ
jgi:hypothetical protein